MPRPQAIEMPTQLVEDVARTLQKFAAVATAADEKKVATYYNGAKAVVATVGGRALLELKDFDQAREVLSRFDGSLCRCCHRGRPCECCPIHAELAT